MKILKTINRKLVSPILMNLNGDKIVRSFTDNTILNVMYHGVVSKSGNYFSPRHISSEQFEKQLKYFAKEFNVISISEAFEYVINNYKPKRKTITISFDDGYSNNLYIALPLLEKYKMKTTFFISGTCTEEMEIRALWPDIISCLMYFNKNSLIEIGNRKFKNLIDAESGISLGDFLNSCDIVTLKHSLDYLISKYNVAVKIKTLPNELWSILNKNELKELSDSKIVDIGSHGYSHYNLANLEISEVKNELRMSKEALQNVVGKDIKIIAFPFGSYSSEVKNVAEQLGYEHQMAVSYLHSDDSKDVRILNRHGISSTTTFEANILLLNNAFRTKGFNGSHV